MKFNKILSLVLFLILLNSSFVFTQTIFTESMGTVAATTTIAAHETANGFDNDSYTMSGTSDLRATTVSSGYTGASGSANVFLTSTIGKDFLISGINTTGCSSISLSLGIYKSTTASNGSDLVIEVSSDGSTYSPLSFTMPTGTGTATWYSITPTGTIPATANLRIRFRQTGATTQFRIDDIILSGTCGSCTAPTNQATTFSATSVTTNSMTVSWTNGGDGDSVLVIARAGSAPTDPTSGTSYPANSVYGSGTSVGGGFAVYRGTGTSVNLTGLTANTTYHFAIYRYNSTGTCYNLTQLIGSQSTLGCWPSTQASVFTSSLITETSMTVSWTRGNGDSVLVIARAGSAPTDPTSGNIYSANSIYGSGTSVGGGFAVYRGTGTSINVTGLTTGTTYYYAIYEFNSTGTCYNYSQLSGNVTTASNSNCLFNDNFGSGLLQWSNNTYWTNIGGEMRVNAAGATTDYNYANIGSQNLSTADYEWNFCLRYTYNPSSGNNFEFFLISDITNVSSISNGYAVGVNRTNTTDVLTLYRVDNGLYTSILVTPYTWITGDDVCIRVVRTAAGNWSLFYNPNGTGMVSGGTVSDVSHTLGSYIGVANEHTLTYLTNLYVDDVSVCGGLPCTDPAPPHQDSMIVVNNISDTSITISWSRTTAYGSLAYINTSNSFTNPSNGTTVFANNVYGGVGQQAIYRGSGNSVTVTGLTPGVVYWFRIYSYNCFGDSLKYNITTAPNNPINDTTILNFGVASVLNFRIIPNVCLDPDSIFKIKVCAEDNGGNLDIDYASPITISINSQPGGATLSGTLTQTSAFGCVVFNDLSLNSLGDYTLKATDGTLNGISDTISVAGSCVGQTIWSGIIINEASNGSSGNQEYYEFLVAGECGQAVDIRGWILDDNNGTYTGTFDKVSGVAAGHVRLKNTPHWQLIPVGSIIVLYNPEDVNATIPPDDPFDSNNDSLYVTPITNVALFEQCNTIPYYNNKNDWDSTYAGCTPYNNATSWLSLSLRNDGDAIQVRTPTGQYFHGISYGYQELATELLTGGPDNLYLKTTSASNTVFYFNDGDYRDPLDWTTSSPVSTNNQTPGNYNNSLNETWVRSLRNAGAATCPISLAAPLSYRKINLSFENSVEGVLLKWNTSSFISEKHIILKSVDGINYEKIGEIEPKEFENEKYSFLDKDLVYNNVLYKIMAYGISSNIVKTGFDNINSINIYPNPAKNNLNISIYNSESDYFKVSIRNLLGHEMVNKTYSFDNDKTLTFDLSTYASGIYIVEVQDKNRILRKRIEIIK